MSLALAKLLYICVAGPLLKSANGLRMHKGTSNHTMPELSGEPIKWQVTTGLDFKDDMAAWRTFLRDGDFPSVLTTWLDNLHGDDLKFKEAFRTEWVEAEKKGAEKDIPPFIESPSERFLLEEGDAVLVAYRVKERDIGFKIKEWTQDPYDEEDEFDIASYSSTLAFEEMAYSRLGTTSIVYWKPTEGFEEPDAWTLQDFPDAKPSKEIELIWDNSYSYFRSKTVLAIVGIFKASASEPVKHTQGEPVETEEITTPVIDQGSGKPLLPPPKKKDETWKKTIEKPVAIAETLANSGSLSQPLLAGSGGPAQPVHPLSKEQCEEAKTRITGKAGFLGEIALSGYLKEIGQKPDKDLMAKVQEAISGGCNIVASDLAVSSDASFLTPEQCLEAKERAGAKTGMLLELVLKHYIKEIGKKPSAKMLSRATEQVTSKCVDPAEQITTEQCLGIKKSAEKVSSRSGGEGRLKEVERGLEAFGNVVTAQLVTETAKQISNSCGVQGNSIKAEEVPRKPRPKPPTAQDAIDKSKAEAAKPGTELDPAECQKAQEAMKGKPSMFVGIHLGKWLEENGKDNSPKTVNAVLAQLKGDCGGKTPEVTVDDRQVNDKEEVEASVSSGTIRRKDFVDDPRFAKYRMMKKIRQPEGAIDGRLTMDKPDLLKAGLTELEIACFFQLLFDKVEECNVAPPQGGKILTKEMVLEDERLKKYKMMQKVGQGRGAVEGRMVMDWPDLVKQGFTEADRDCILKLLFDGDTECDASPAGKILGPEFLEHDAFKKYKMMKKIGQGPGAVEGRLIMDMPDLEKQGFSKTELLGCFVKLLFEEVTQCILGPAEREKKLSKEAKGLAAAKDISEKLNSLLDGDNGLMPGVMPSLDWATDIFQGKIPKKDTTPQEPKQGGGKKGPEIETLLDGKTQQNLGITLAQFPKNMIFEGHLMEIGRGEWTFTRDKKNEEDPEPVPLMADLETLQRAIATVDDAVIADITPKVDKITERHDVAHRFVKAMITVKKENPDFNPDAMITCIVQKDKYGVAISNKADTLQALEEYYETAGKLGGTLSAAVNGFVSQLLQARVQAGKEDGKVTKEALGEYDNVLRKFRQGSGGGDEADVAIVPLLALNNVIIDKGMRLRVGLLRSHPDAAKKFSPTYLELFKAYLKSVSAAETKQALQAQEEPPLTFAQCEEVVEAKSKAKNPMFAEMALNNALKQIGKFSEKAKVIEMLKKPCEKPPAAQPMTDTQCQEALDVLKATPNPMMQGIKLAGYFKSIEKCKVSKSDCQKQVDAGCPSSNPPEPLYQMSTLEDQCRAVVAIKDEPSLRNSVRGAIYGIEETQKSVTECVSVMPALKQAPYEELMEEGDVVIEAAKQIQEKIFDTMIQTAAPFLPHTEGGSIDREALWKFYKSFPQPGGNDDDARIRGSNGVAAKYAISDFLDDEALRYSFRTICTEILKK